jgi:hypothetical protein
LVSLSSTTRHNSSSVPPQQPSFSSTVPPGRGPSSPLQNWRGALKRQQSARPRRSNDPGAAASWEGPPAGLRPPRRGEGSRSRRGRSRGERVPSVLLGGSRVQAPLFPLLRRSGVEQDAQEARAGAGRHGWSSRSVSRPRGSQAVLF